MKLIYDETAISRTLKRMAHEILEKNKGADDLILLGIVKRGDVLSRRIAAEIADIEHRPIPSAPLDVRPYRDDRPFNQDIPVLPFTVEDKIVILVDDVLFHGRTVRAAMEAVIRAGRPKEIQLAALIDRGHRQLPIRADYVGKNLPTSLLEEVEVHLRELDGEDAVRLRKL